MYYFKTSSAYENTIITKINAPQETWQKTFFLISPNDTMLILKLTTRKIYKEKVKTTRMLEECFHSQIIK